MRILFVNPYYKPYLGGIERIIERLSAELLLDDRVQAVGVLTTRAHFPDRIVEEWPSREVIDGVQVFRCSFKPATFRHVFHAAMAGYVSADVWRVLREFEPDVIHFTYSEWWSANLLTYLASRGTPHVLSTFFHELPVNWSTRPLFAVNRWLVRRIDAIHVLSEAEKGQVSRAYGARPDRFEIIPPGVEVPATLPDRPDSGVVTILAVGRLIGSKGQLRLVHIVRKLLEQSPELRVRLWLAGEDAGDGEEILQTVREARLDSVVELLGRVSDERLPELYRQADIFALPTRVESFGLVFVEAMAYGAPVVAYAVGPVPTILTEGAILVPPGDEDAFGEALRSLILDSARRRQLGIEGYGMVLERYSWKRMAQAFMDMYNGILCRAPATS